MNKAKLTRVLIVALNLSCNYIVSIVMIYTCVCFIVNNHNN